MVGGKIPLGLPLPKGETGKGRKYFHPSRCFVTLEAELQHDNGGVEIASSAAPSRNDGNDMEG
jgi:hypothetical protein